MKNKILAIPSAECKKLFDKLCSIGKKQLSWEIACIAPKYYLRYYKNFIDSEDQLYELPTLLKDSQWQLDENQKSEIKALILAAEKKVGIPINRILLSCERDVGRAYSKQKYYFPENEIAYSVLKNSEFSEDILLKSFKFVADVLRKFRPDLCIGAPPAGILPLTVYYLTHYYDIPFVYSIFSMSLPDRHYWSKGWGGFNDRVKEVFYALKNEKRLPTSRSIEYISRFRNRPEPMPIYITLWGDNNRDKGFFSVNKMIVQRFLNRIIPFVKRIKVSNPKPFWQFFLDAYRTLFLKMIQKSMYRRYSSAELEKFKYIYYPCHQEPEFVLNVRATNWYDQLNTIKKLSYNLPYGYKLLVREHRFNVGRKRTTYLKEVASYPGVVLVDGYDDQYKYIENADLIVTVNGTTGFEGLMLKKKILTLDKTNYDVIVQSTCYGRYVDLGSAIMNTIAEERYCSDEDIALFLDAERLTSFRDEEISIEEIHYIFELARGLEQVASMETASC